ncbi:protein DETOXIFICATION 43 isoform X1 [Solanum stenotomum]|uniref:protein DETOXIFICATION 43 isoform X1 n=1 Tax=Solanum stenotomum TaxID=172797 RepID=UPI0020D1AF3E|nr:protein DETOXIFICATION 43 isoform X1 [Solanum stenotomum]XP_049412558.1 protein DETOXIFICATION 43 isoform X1 [Solanum stenotomum]
MAEVGNVACTERRWNIPIFVFFEDIRNVFKFDDLGMEILRIAFPAALALAADPIASLIDTAFIGHLGAVEIAAVGVSIAIFNQASKVTIFPLVNITTSFVAEEDTVRRISEKEAKADLEKGKMEKNDSTKQLILTGDNNNDKTETKETVLAPGISYEFNFYTLTVIFFTITKQNNVTFTEFKTTKCESLDNKSKGKLKHVKRHIPSASTAILMGCILGILQTIFLIFLAKPILSLMGVKSDSPMLSPAKKYLTLRAIGAPAVLLSLAMQGVFRGFKDTRTPLLATVAGDLTNIILDPIFIFVFRWGVSGAAIAHVLSQYLISIILLFKLMTEVDLLPPSAKDLQFSKFLKNGFWLLARVIAVTFCVTLAASLAARLGTTQMAAFQVCLQIWLTSSLLADGLAVAGQAILASSFAEKDFQKAKAAGVRVLQMGLVLGFGLSIVVAIGLYFGSGVFSKDKNVIRFIIIAIPFVAGTQPINSVAFVLDGVNFGANDFAYSAYSMVLVGALTITCEFVLSKTNGYIGIWIALAIFMVLRTFAGLWRMGTGTGPWRFLRVPPMSAEVKS